MTQREEEEVKNSRSHQRPRIRRKIEDIHPGGRSRLTSRRKKKMTSGSIGRGSEKELIDDGGEEKKGGSKNQKGVMRTLQNCLRKIAEGPTEREGGGLYLRQSRDRRSGCENQQKKELQLRQYT